MSIDEWIKKMYTHAIEYYSALKRKKSLTCYNTMNLKNITLYKISQTHKDKYCMTLLT